MGALLGWDEAGLSNNNTSPKLQPMLTYSMDMKMTVDEYGNVYDVPKAPAVKKVASLPSSLPDTPEMRAKCIAAEPDIFKMAYTIMMDDEASNKDRLAAGALMLDRGRGKATQSVEVNQRVQSISRVEVVLV